MQFLPNLGLEEQLKKLSGGDVLEDVVASTLSYLGYTVLAGVKVDMEGEDICEIDVFASLHTPLKENRIIFECKGGEPTFKEIRNLHSLYSILDPRPDECIAVCKDQTRPNRIELGRRLGVRILKKSDLIKWLLPLLSGGTSRGETTKQLNRWMTYYSVQRFLRDKAREFQKSKQQARFLHHHLWWKADPIAQAQESFDKARTEYLNVTHSLAEAKGIKLRSYLKKANDDVIEGTMFIELLHRIINMYAVTRCSLHFHTSLGREDLLQTFGPNLRDSIVQIGQSPRLLYGFPAFFQYWISHWGGILMTKKEGEMHIMADECKTTTEAISAYLDVIRSTYSSESSDGLVYIATDKVFFKYVPGAIRGLGILNRKKKGLLNQDESVFSAEEDRSYLEALSRSLTDTGGLDALQW